MPSSSLLENNVLLFVSNLVSSLLYGMFTPFFFNQLECLPCWISQLAPGEKKFQRVRYSTACRASSFFYEILREASHVVDKKTELLISRVNGVCVWVGVCRWAVLG